MFLSTKPNATFNLAAHLRLSNTTSNFSNSYLGAKYPRQCCRLSVSYSPITVHQKKFARFQSFLQAIVINVSHYVCNINILSSQKSLCSMFLPLMFSQIVRAVKVFVIYFPFLNNRRSCSRVFHGNMIIRVSSGICRKVDASRACKESSWKSPLVTYNIVSCSLGSTIFASLFLD